MLGEIYYVFTQNATYFSGYFIQRILTLTYGKWGLAGAVQLPRSHLHFSNRSCIHLTKLNSEKADRTAGVNCYYIFQYFVGHGLTSSGNVFNLEKTLQFIQTR